MAFKFDSKEKNEMRKSKSATWQSLLSALVVAGLIGGTSGFTSMAKDVDTSTVDYEKDIETEILEATLIDTVDSSSEALPYTMLTSCIIGVTGDSDGMHIDISTATVGTASVLGVKDVKIQKKTWYGGWSTVAVSSGGEAHDRSSMGVNILYSNAVKDATYRIKCIHYGDVDGYIEGENDSGEFVFTY